jgi:hypothetical protein
MTIKATVVWERAGYRKRKPLVEVHKRINRRLHSYRAGSKAKGADKQQPHKHRQPHKQGIDAKHYSTYVHEVKA